MAKESKAGKAKEAEWKALPLERYAEVLAELVLFSFKTSNSNIPAGGVRLSRCATQPDTMLLPYVSVKTLLAQEADVHLDYQKNTGNVATVVKQLRMVQQNATPSTVNQSECQAIADLVATLTNDAAEFGMDEVSPRMRQVLLPRNPYSDADGYVSFSPVGAGGLNALLNAEIEKHNEAAKSDKSLRRLRQAYLQFGGANPQNVGSLVRDMQTPMFCTAPQENPEIRKALALYHDGAQPIISHEIMLAWQRWFLRVKKDNLNETRTNLKTRSTEEAFSQAIMRNVLAQGRSHFRFLIKMQKYLPRDPNGELLGLLSPSIPFFIKAWIIPDLRDATWENEFAGRISARVSNYRFKDDLTLGVQHPPPAIGEAMLELLVKERLR